ncbi:MAG: T9SS type A sorting domain-containing protein [Flavobacteriales bacterium]|nr:T9SS type A sorting domain-containing protein [Flavobacteriales bacterium]MCB9365045.1 T9SS type A sorting domain-containing protein [Flavobacteriales bacterium]
MKKSTLLLSSLVLSTVLTFGQNSRKAGPIIKTTPTFNQERVQELVSNAKRTPDGKIRCFTTEYNQLLKETYPNRESTEEFENWISKKILEAENNNSNQKKATRNIPVVVHVIHNGDALGSGENISDAQVLSQIDALNEDFSATNTDFGNVPAAFQSVAASMDIQFCLATEDPNGNPSSGIDRVNYGTASFGNSATESMKAATSWDPSRYFNIWVLRFGGDLNGVLGYAQFPSSSGLSGLSSNGGAANTDGVAIGYNYFGTTGAVSSPFNKGRTATHEIGHCFGLRHIWGEDGSGGCNADDYVTDTPNQQSENYGCPSHPSASCSNGGDMFMNFMDYVNDACMHTFTAGQKARMDAVLQNSPRRASLLTSTVCGVSAITANFTGTPTTINENGSVTFTDASSSPDNLLTWNWTFNGGTPSSFSGQTPPAITYTTAGQYDVTLTVTDDNSGTDTETKTMYITVNPAGTSTCDSTVAGWDWYTEGYGGMYWTQDAAACNLPLEGYVVGNNCYDDNGWASKMSNPASGKELVEVRYVFHQSSGTGGAQLKIWDGDGTGGAPGTVLAAAAITTGQFSANLNQFISVPISPAIDLDLTSADFFIGYDHDVTPLDGDTIVMGLAAGTSGNTVWAKEAGSGWLDLSTYGVDSKGTVVAIVCDNVTGIQSHLSDLSSIVAYPNPTTGIVEVMLPRNNATVSVVNMIGEEVANSSTTSNLLKLDLSNQPNGVYFIKVSSNGELTTKKILLSK